MSKKACVPAPSFGARKDSVTLAYLEAASIYPGRSDGIKPRARVRARGNDVLAVASERLGDFVGRVTLDELRRINDALRLALELD